MIIGDILVTDDRLHPKYENGTVDPNQKADTIWGITMISLMFLPNIVFLGWFIHGNRRKLCSKEGITKIFAVSCVQLIALIRLVDVSMKKDYND